MAILPAAFIDSLNNIKGFDREAFEKVHASGEQVTSIRVNPAKWSVPASGLPADPSFQVASAIPWAQHGFYLSARPSFTFDPLFHAGCYYVQEASSMFVEQALKQTCDLSQALKVLDLCAAPGGKSTHLQSLLSKDSLLVSNEVIKSRNNILVDNIVKWGCNNVFVSQNDPKQFAALENYFDVMLVDAPCSGSGLFRRDEVAIDEWSVNNVQLCCQRQQRILADALPALKKGGVLIYSTCSYSKEEDEDIMQWLVAENEMQPIELSVNDGWGIVTTESNGARGYRFYPDKVKGEGFFIACFRKKSGDDFEKPRQGKKPEMLSKKEIALVQPWLQDGDFSYYKFYDHAVAIPEILAPDSGLLLSQLRITYFGTKLGVLVRDKMIPDHALAMSSLLAKKIERLELSFEQAIQYLQRKDISLHAKHKGWQLVTYLQHPLGWVNVLPNRINNYYPKELRILKELKN